MRRELWWATLLASALGMSAQAKEVELKPADVPAAVQQSIAARYPNAKAKRFTKDLEHGKPEYEAVLETDGKTAEVTFSAEGKVLSEEDRLAPADLPAAVQKGLASSAFAHARVLRAEKELTGKTTRYELLVEQQGKKSELLFNSRGKLTRSGPADPDEDAAR